MENSICSPLDVRLFDDGSTIDLLIICKKDILTKKGCTGAPDWIIDPFRELVIVFNFEDAQKSAMKNLIKTSNS